MAKVWTERVEAILADPQQVKLAAAAWFVITNHLQHCLHQRTCPEEVISNEAYDIVGYTEREEMKGRDES